MFPTLEERERARYQKGKGKELEKTSIFRVHYNYLCPKVVCS